MAREIFKKSGNTLELLEDLKLSYGSIVPQGFKWDGMSSPKWVEFIGIGNNDLDQELCSCVHDYEYRLGTTTPRLIADQNLYKNLRKLGEPIWRCRAIFIGVRIGGESHYNTK